MGDSVAATAGGSHGLTATPKRRPTLPKEIGSGYASTSLVAAGNGAIGSMKMEREARRFMWAMHSIGCVFAVAVGLAAGDRGMVTGALAAFVGGVIVAPFVARMWR